MGWNRASQGCPEAFPLSKTKQRTRSCSVAGRHLYHLICPSYYVKIIKVTLLFYFKLNFSKLPSFSTNIAYADRSVLSFCSLCLHCPFHSLVSGDLRWMGVVGAQSCMAQRRPGTSFTVLTAHSTAPPPSRWDLKSWLCAGHTVGAYLRWLRQ